jgi:glycosyltransferase involved in cell wall biosynthesis
LTDICVVASGDWASFSRVNCHEIATRWTAFGRVCYIEPAPMRAPRLHDAGRLAGRLRGVLRKRNAPEPGRAPTEVEVVAPAFVPWSPIAPVRAWNVGAAAHAVRRRATERQWPFRFDVLWFFSVPLAGLEARIPHRLVIYHAVDDYAANPGVDPELLRRREGELLERADLVFAVSEPLAERLRARHKRVAVWENVSDTEPLLDATQSHPGKKRESDPPVAAYVGNLSLHKVDFALLLEVVRGMTDWRFVLAGPIGDLGDAGRRVLKESNVQYVGPVERTELPRIFADADVALLPLPAGDLHESSFPIKVLDYLALCLPIVGRRTAALVEYAGVILDASGAEGYRRAMEEGRTLRLGQDFRQRARDLAHRNSWSGRMVDLEKHVRRALGLVTSSGHKDPERTKVSQGAALREASTQREQ